MSNQTQVNSNNNFAEMLFKSSLNQTNEKNQKAEDQGLLALSSVLSSMESTLSGPMKDIIHTSTDIDVASKDDVFASTNLNISSALESHSIASIAKILGAAAAATNTLESISSKSTSDQSDDMNKISKALIQFSKAMPAKQLLQLESLVKEITTTFFGTSDESKGALNNTTIEQMQESLSKLAATITDTKDGGPTNYQLIQALSAMTSDVNNLQGTIAQVGSDEAKSSADVSEALVVAAQANQKNVENEIAKQQEEAKKEHRHKLIGKILGAIISVVVAVCTFGAGAPVMALCILGMTALSESGALTKLSSAIATSLQNDGMSSTAAKALADALTVVVVVTATVIAGGVGSKTLLKDAAVKGVEEGSEVAAKKAAKMTVKDYVVSFAKKVGENNPFRKIPAFVNLGIAAGFQTAQQTGLFSDIATASMTAQGASQAQIDAVVEKINYTMGAVTLLVSAATLDGGMNGVTASTTAARFNNFSETATKAFKALDITANIVLASVKSGIDINIGTLQLEQANTEYAVAQGEATVQILDTQEKVINDLSDNNMKATSSTIQADGQVSQETQSSILSFETTVTQIMSHAV